MITPENTRLVDRICSETMELLIRTQGHRDDVTVLALQRVPQRVPFEVHLPVSGSSSKFVRDRLRAWLLALGATRGSISGVEHAVSELVDNAVEHAYVGTVGPSDTVEVTGVLGPDGHVRVTVRDAGSWKSPNVNPNAENRGRGLALARLLIDNLAVDGTASGTTAVVTQRVTRNAGIHTSVDSMPAPSAAQYDFVLDETRPGLLVVRGDLDPRVVPTFAGRIDRLSNGGTQALVVDLNGVTHLGSSAVAALLRASSRDGHRESRLTLSAKPGTVAHHVLGLLGLDANLWPRDSGDEESEFDLG